MYDLPFSSLAAGPSKTIPLYLINGVATIWDPQGEPASTRPFLSSLPDALQLFQRADKQSRRPCTVHMAYPASESARCPASRSKTHSSVYR